MIFRMSLMYINSNLNPLTKPSSISSTKFQDIHAWNISNDQADCSNQQNNRKLCSKRPFPFESEGNSIETETTT